MYELVRVLSVNRVYLINNVYRHSSICHFNSKIIDINPC